MPENQQKMAPSFDIPFPYSRNHSMPKWQDELNFSRGDAFCAAKQIPLYGLMRFQVQMRFST